MPHYPKRKTRPIPTSSELLQRSALNDDAVWVQLVRAKCGLTQEQLADLAKMHPAQISAYETGSKTPRPATRARLAAAVATTPEQVQEAARAMERRPSQGVIAGSSRAATLGEWIRGQVETTLADVAARLRALSAEQRAAADDPSPT